MRFRVTAYGSDGKVFVGEDSDLSDALAEMSQCVDIAGSRDDCIHLAANLNELRKVAVQIPDDYFGVEKVWRDGP